jgi:hypothetical protein
MALVEARFAGGAIEVTALAEKTPGAPELVGMVLPVNAVALFPDEARRLAISLIEAASTAERPEPPEWP